LPQYPPQATLDQKNGCAGGRMLPRDGCSNSFSFFFKSRY
jgi:hypothetical protein